MRNTKWMRFLLIALSVVMVLSLFACGNGTTEEETTVDNTNDETTVADDETTVADDETTVADDETTVADDETTVEDTTVEDTTVEDTTVEDTTVEDTTVEDTTVEDTTEEETTEEETTVPGYISGEAIYNAGVHSTYTATLNADGTVTVTSNQAGADQTIDITAFATITARYMVVKYKTEGGSVPYVYATTGDRALIGGYTNGAIIDDGEWHYMAVDLTKVSNGGYVIGQPVVFLRLDVCEGAAGESMTIEYIQLVDDISDIASQLPKNYKKNIDHVYTDGNESVELNSASTVTGSSIQFNCWVAADGCTATGGYYIVTDANGEKTIVEIPLVENADAEGVIKMFTRDDITQHVQGQGYSADTLGYVYNVDADLSAFAGQTVTIRLVMETNDGATVSFHKVIVNVPAAQ